MSEILEQYEEQNIKKTYKRKFFFKLFVLFIGVILFAIYVGDTLFGTSSLDVLLNLQADKDLLQKRVLYLKRQNASLQKEYFELKQLDPESE